MIEAAEHVSAGWSDGAEIDINGEMTRVALRVVGRTIFDADVESEAPEIARGPRRRACACSTASCCPAPSSCGGCRSRPRAASTRPSATSTRFLGRLVAERAVAAGGGDLVAVLHGLQDERRRPCARDVEIRDEAITLMLAGHETTAQALTWSWYLLARTPPPWEALRAELAALLGGRPPAPADFARLPYTQAVFREALRLYPPVWALARIATRPYRSAPTPSPRAARS